MIPEERRRNGLYQSLEDFVKRTGIGLEQAITLIRVGALRFTGKSKKALLWAIHLLLGAKAEPNAHAELFCLGTKNYSLPVLVNIQLENAYHELELLGFPLSMFDLLQTAYSGEIGANDLITTCARS